MLYQEGPSCFAATDWELAASEIAAIPGDDNHRTTIMLSMTSSPADSQIGAGNLGDPHGALKPLVEVHLFVASTMLGRHDRRKPHVRAPRKLALT